MNQQGQFQDDPSCRRLPTIFKKLFFLPFNRPGKVVKSLFSLLNVLVIFITVKALRSNFVHKTLFLNSSGEVSKDTKHVAENKVIHTT